MSLKLLLTRILPILIAVLLCEIPAANALLVGGNIDVHNNTGLTVNDFHVEGTIKSTSDPKLSFKIGYADGTSFPNFTNSFTPVGGDIWNFSAAWSGLDVNDSQTGHFGLFFDVSCRNVWINLDGYWTLDGNRIGDWPILGFEVPTHWWDPPAEQLFRLQGAGIETTIQQMDMLLRDPPEREEDMESLLSMLNTNDMDGLGDWSAAVFEPNLPADSFFDVFTEVVLNRPILPDQLLITRTKATWSEEPDGRWFFHVHQAHPIPEPTTLFLLGSGLLGFAGFKRKFKKKNK
jgi:PEP-CTERM motif-containing protein